ncbi:MAG: FAD-dependent oxidoreductase [Kineosporiaceae bacterium]|nr:FAD-dependent oxidoreductase [Kineosporiaceae bacterium]
MTPLPGAVPTPAHPASISFWHESLIASGEDAMAPRPALDGDLEVDVAVIGGGYTGLWTAYYLLAADPALRVVVIEARIAGFGASGRNGGWCSALFPRSTASLARSYGREAALAMRRAMHSSVREVGRVCQDEQIDAHYRRGGTISLARSAVQLRRARVELAADIAFDGIDEIALLDPAATAEHVRASAVLGATYTPHCARIHPARLVRGLARAVERRGGRIVEGTTAERVELGTTGSGSRVVTDRGTVRAAHVVRAIEAWTAHLPLTAGTTGAATAPRRPVDPQRAVIPVYSLMVATEPLPAAVWDEIGLARGQTVNDHRHLIIYGQRTADDRLVFGGRGAPYHFGSAIRADFDRDESVFAALRSTARELFPALGPTDFTHAWGGPLGISRDWHASVGLDRSTGFAWAGAYVGDGVGTANLAGRTLADLIRGVDSDLTTLPWVNHAWRAWEPEPVRWLAVNAGLRTMTAADAEERLTGRPSVLARFMGPFLGH